MLYLRRQRFYLSLLSIFIGSYTSCISQTTDAPVFWEQLLAKALELQGEGNFEAVEMLESQADSFLTTKGITDSLAYCKFLQTLANSHYNRYQYIDAQRIYNQALEVAPSYEEGRNLYGSILYDRAFVEYEMQDYKTSYESVVQSEAVLSLLEKPDYDYLLSVYSDLAFQATGLGYWEEGEKYLLKGFRVLDQHEDEVIYLSLNQSRKRTVFNYTALNLYASMGNEEKLLARFRDFQRYASQHELNTGEQYMYAVGLNHIADFYLNFDERWQDEYPYVQAQKFLTASFEALDSAKYPANYAQFLFNQNKCYRKAGLYDLALQGNAALLALVDSTDGRMPFFLAQKSLIYGASKHPKEALQAFEAMLNLIHQGTAKLSTNYENFKPSPKINHSDLIAGVMEKLLADLGGNAEVERTASRVFPLALSQFEHTYQYQFMNPKLAEFYEKITQGILQYNVLKKAYSSISTADLLTRMEKIENRLAWQAHLQNRNVKALGIPDSVLEQELYLRNRIAQAKVAGETPAVLFEWEDQLNKLERNIHATYPTHARFVATDFNLKTIQAQLDVHDVILKYQQMGNQLFLFSIHKSLVEVFDLGAMGSVDSMLKLLLISVEQGGSPVGDSLSASLFPFSLQPFQSLYILPSGNLHSLPFGMLKQGNQYLIEQHPISYASHLVFLFPSEKTAKIQRPSHELLAYAPSSPAPQLTQVKRAKGVNLPGAYRESTLISQLFNGKLYGGKEAQKSIFLSTAPQARMLHLAMHAQLNDSSPELSYLLFDEKEAGGKLYVEELYGMNLQAELAVLSACNTAKGAQDTRKGMVSVARAFSYAGVPATVASLWAVPDKATQELMQAFYTKLKNGENKAEALRQAKLSYLAAHQGEPLAEPLYWAGFVVYGNVQAIYPASLGRWLWIIGTLLFLSLIGLFSFQTLSKRLPIGTRKG